MFRCLYGTVAFKGVNPEKVYEDIRHRRIQWPPEEIIDQYMSKEAQDLIGRMIQISPGNRLGATLETLAILKQHPFFAGIDFDEVSSPDFSGLK